MNTNFKNKTILITGGTGSFGRSFVERIIKFGPKKIIIFSRDEQKHNEMMISEEFKNIKQMRYFIGDIRDLNRLILATKNVDIIIHAAAMKHVHLCEYNPIECVNTNIIGAKNLVEASISNNVKKLIAISTDKAVNPINIYGASKLTSDKIFLSSNNLSASKTKFSVTRYGNVIGSKGSIIDIYKNMIKNGSKFLPLTDPKMTRFFISMDECVSFISNCLKIMRGGEIFIPKSTSMSLKEFINYLNYKKPLKTIGIRSGEKLHENLISKLDNTPIFESKKMYIQCINDKLLLNFYKKHKDFKKIDPFDYVSSNKNGKKNITSLKKIISKSAKL